MNLFPTSHRLFPKIQPKNGRIFGIRRAQGAQRRASGGPLNRIVPCLKSPGGKHNVLTQDIASSAFTRIPVYAILFLVLNHEEYSPLLFTFHFMSGPSMLPTIFPAGECYIGLKLWYLSLIQTPLKVGDVIVFKDAKGGHACKRVQGLGGDIVNRFGEYSHLYLNETDLGIREIPTDFGDWESQIKVMEINGKTMATIPNKMLWVEGDNPLHSVDSRHYGPISESAVIGRVMYRLWPRHRDESASCIVHSKRPHPLTENEMYSGLYNITKLPYSK